MRINEALDESIPILERHIQTLRQWYDNETNGEHKRVLRESESLHSAMVLFCSELKKLLENEQFKKFDRAYLQSSHQISQFTPANITLPENSGIQDCNHKLREICHYFIALRKLSVHQEYALPKYYARRAQYAEQVEKIAVFFGISLAILSAIITGSSLLAVATPFLLYFVFPALLITACILPFAVEYQKVGSFSQAFATEFAALQEKNPILSKTWTFSLLKLSAESEFAQKEMEFMRAAPLCSAPASGSPRLPVSLTLKPTSALDFSFFAYPHPKQLSEESPPQQYNPN